MIQIKTSRGSTKDKIGIQMDLVLRQYLEFRFNKNPRRNEFIHMEEAIITFNLSTGKVFRPKNISVMRKCDFILEE